MSKNSKEFLEFMNKKALENIVETMHQLKLRTSEKNLRKNKTSQYWKTKTEFLQYSVANHCSAGCCDSSTGSTGELVEEQPACTET